MQEVEEIGESDENCKWIVRFHMSSKHDKSKAFLLKADLLT